MKAGDPRHGQAKKTHCPAGHPYSGDNLVLRPHGRMCRICHNKQAVASRARARMRAETSTLTPTKAFCIRGHPYDGANSFVSGGQIRCRECHREHDAAVRRRRAAARAAQLQSAPPPDWRLVDSSVYPAAFGLCHIYALCEPDSGEVRYIGMTKQSLVARLKQHIKDSRRERARSHLTYWLRSLSRASTLPQVKLLCTVAERTWQGAESACIELYGETCARLVNSTRGGEGRCAPLPEWVREKLRGRRFTAVHRARISAAAKSRPRHSQSPETRAKIGAANRLRVQSAETRAKIAAARRNPKSQVYDLAVGDASVRR